MKIGILRRCVAECVGTFALVFIGCTARAMIGDTTDFAGILVVHLAFAFTIAAMIYTLSHISAAIFNPALTLGFAVSGRFPWRCVLPYWLAQFSGAVLAVGLDRILLPQKASEVHFGATMPKAGILSALIIEIILTFFLMLVNMSSATDKRFKRADSGLAVGFVILVSGSILWVHFLGRSWQWDCIRRYVEAAIIQRMFLRNPQTKKRLRFKRSLKVSILTCYKPAANNF